MFARLGRWSFRRRRIVVLGWVAFAVGAGALLGAVGTETRTEFSLPDVESRHGVDILEEHFDGRGAGMNAPLVFEADQGVNDPEVRAAMEELFASIDAMDEDISVVSPYSEEGEGQVAVDGPLEGQLAYATIEMSSDFSFEEGQELGQEIRDDLPDVAGLQIALGGEIFADWEEPTAELVGLAFAIVILIVAFGSVIAMGLPIGVALAGIGIGTTLGGFVSHVLEVPEFAQMLAVMIGLGVGIDYALFIVTRFRENRATGLDVERSITSAIDTAGRAVIFAGITVVISLLGMIIMQLGFITGMAVSVAMVVLVTMAASVTLLPALVGFVSDRMEVTRWRGVIAAGCVSAALLGVAFSFAPLLIGLPLAAIVLLAGFMVAPLRRTLRPRRSRPMQETLPYRWSRVIQHRPWPAVAGGTVLLVLLALPLFGLRLGFADEGNYPTNTDTREAYDLLAEGFGPGYNGPLLLTAELPAEGAEPARLLAVTTALEADDGIVAVSPPIPNDPDSPTAVMWQVIPTTSPQDAETADLVHDLRGDVLPEVTESSGVDIAVAGSVAMNVDFTDYLGDRLALFLGAVLVLSFLLLMAVFRSILVPLKAVIMNLLGIGAAYGVVIAIFQWGWLGSVIGVAAGPVEPFMPMMLFAIVFGLSMDYEVFLLSRIREDYLRTGDSRGAVANGLAATARVITAAAAIMIVVFSAFALGDDRVLKMAGIGLGVAVLLDATIIRMLLVPATMELLGDRNWWLPGWLDRILPSIDVEGHAVGPDDLPDETGGTDGTTGDGDGDDDGGGGPLDPDRELVDA